MKTVARDGGTLCLKRTLMYVFFMGHVFFCLTQRSLHLPAPLPVACSGLHMDKNGVGRVDVWCEYEDGGMLDVEGVGSKGGSTAQWGSRRSGLTSVPCQRGILQVSGMHWHLKEYLTHH